MDSLLKNLKLIIENNNDNSIKNFKDSNYNSNLIKAKDLNTSQQDLEELAKKAVNSDIVNAIIDNPNSGFNVLKHIAKKHPDQAAKVANHPLVQLDFLENPDLIHYNRLNSVANEVFNNIAKHPDTPESIQNMLYSNPENHFSLSLNPNLNHNIVNKMFDDFHQTKNKPNDLHSDKWRLVKNILSEHNNLPQNIIDKVESDLQSGKLEAPYYGFYSNKRLSPNFLKKHAEVITSLYPEYRKNKNTFILRKSLENILGNPNLGIKAEKHIKNAFGSENGPRLSDHSNESNTVNDIEF